MYVCSVLVPQELVRNGIVSSNHNMMLTSISTSQRNLAQSTDVVNPNQHLKVEQGKNIVDTQLDISSYRLLNKILYYLSSPKLDAQLSFYQLVPRFKDLTSFTFFNNYVNSWL